MTKKQKVECNAIIHSAFAAAPRPQRAPETPVPEAAEAVNAGSGKDCLFDENPPAGLTRRGIFFRGDDSRLSAEGRKGSQGRTYRRVSSDQLPRTQLRPGHSAFMRAPERRKNRGVLKAIQNSGTAARDPERGERK